MKAILVAVLIAIALGIGVLSAIPNVDANPCVRNPASCR